MAEIDYLPACHANQTSYTGTSTLHNSDLDRFGTDGNTPALGSTADGRCPGHKTSTVATCVSCGPCSIYYATHNAESIMQTYSSANKHIGVTATAYKG